MESWAMVRASSPYMKRARRKKAPTRVATGERRAAAMRERDRAETESRSVVAAEGAGGSEGLPMALAGAGDAGGGGAWPGPKQASEAKAAQTKRLLPDPEDHCCCAQRP
jgi:hypothetical protein